MSHGFLAFIDETGSEGDHDKPGGFEFMGISAVVVRSYNIQFLHDIWDRARYATRKRANWDWPSFKDINSDRHKFLIADLIGNIPIRFATILAHKPSLTGLSDHGDLYFFITQLLVERISWICRDAWAREAHAANKQCRIIISDRAAINYSQFRYYVLKLKHLGGRYHSKAEWDYIDIEAICSRVHKNTDGLRIADFIASSFGAASEYKSFGITDDRFVRLMATRAYRSLYGNCFRNGLKIYPTSAEALLLEEERFRWIKSHFM